MAERQQVFRWVRDLLAAGLVALTVTTLTVQTIQDVDTISGANSGGSGDCQLDMCSTTPDKIDLSVNEAIFCGSEGGSAIECNGVEACLSHDGQRVCAEQNKVSIEAGNDGATLEISADSGISVTSGNNLHVIALDINMTPSSAFAVTAIDEVAIQSSGGGYIGTTTDGVQLVAGNAGDDITLSTLAGGDDIALSSGDDLTLAADPTSGAVELTASGNLFRLDATGIAGDVNGVGDDIIFTATDLVTLATDTGGQVQTVPGGVNIIAASVGDGVTIEAADAVTIDAGSILATIGAGGPAYPLGGLRLAQRTTSFTPPTTAEAVVSTISIPADAWDAVGESLVVVAFGSTAGNTNSKTVRVRLGSSGACLAGTVVGSLNFDLVNDARWYAEFTVTREGPNFQYGNAIGYGATGAGVSGTMLAPTASAAINESAVIDACITVENATANTDLVVDRVRFFWR